MFSIVMGADNSFYVKSIANLALTFFGYIISVLVSVGPLKVQNKTFLYVTENMFST